MFAKNSTLHTGTDDGLIRDQRGISAHAIHTCSLGPVVTRLLQPISNLYRMRREKNQGSFWIFSMCNPASIIPKTDNSVSLSNTRTGRGVVGVGTTTVQPGQYQTSDVTQTQGFRKGAARTQRTTCPSGCCTVYTHPRVLVSREA